MSEFDEMKTSASLQINFTGRIDLAPKEMEYDLKACEDGLEYRVRFTSFLERAREIRPECQVVLSFSGSRRVATARCNHGDFSDLCMENGVVRGIIDNLDEAENVSVRFMLVDPDTGRIRASCSRSGPDGFRVNENDQGRSVTKRSEMDAEGSSLLDFRERNQQLPWVLDFEQRVPILYLSSKVGKGLFESNTALRASVLQGVFCEMLTTIILFEESVSHLEWVSDWKEFAAGFAPDGLWESYYDGDPSIAPSPAEVRERVLDAAESFVGSFKFEYEVSEYEEE